MWEGTVGDKVYLILDGEALVRRAGVEVARLGPGELVGEGAFAEKRLRNATIVARSPLRVLAFPDTAWTSLTSRYEALSMKASEVAASRH